MGVVDEPELEAGSVVARDDDPDVAGGSSHPSSWRARLKRVALRPELGLPLILVGLCIYLGFASPYFWQWQNLLNIAEAVSVIGIAAAFATVVIISGGLDFTPIAVMTITGIVVTECLAAGMPIWLAVIVSLLAASGIGLLNGSLIAGLGLNPFIVTIGTTFLFTGVAFVITDGESRLIEDPDFLALGQSKIFFNIPIDVVWMLAVFAVAFVLLRFTRLGIHVFAVGGGAYAARLSGVRVNAVKLTVYILAALASGIAGIVLAANAGQVGVYAATSSNDLLAILAAVIIGGTALSGGRGGVVGTLVGIFLLGVIGNGLTLLNISSFWQPVVLGTILLVAIILDELRRRATVAVA